MRENRVAGRWIRDQTKAVTGRDAYDEEHPGFKDYHEVIVYSLARDEPRRTSSGLILLRRQTWQVVVIIDRNDPDGADSLHELVETALHKKTNQEVPEEGGRVLQAQNVGPALKYSSRDPSGRIYRHSGSFYELWVQATA